MKEDKQKVGCFRQLSSIKTWSNLDCSYSYVLSMATTSRYSASTLLVSAVRVHKRAALANTLTGFHYETADWQHSKFSRQHIWFADGGAVYRTGGLTQWTYLVIKWTTYISTVDTSISVSGPMAVLIISTWKEVNKHMKGFSNVNKHFIM